MPSLLETIQQNMSSQAQPVQATDQTSRVRQLLAAKTGKAVGPTQSAVSSQAEQAQLEQSNQAMGQLGQQVQLQQASMGQQQQDIQQKEQQQRQQLELQQQQQQQQAQLQTSQILSDLERNRGQLDLDKDRARLEQLGHSLAMQDRTYVRNLQMAGQQARLDSDLGFREALARATLGNNLDFLKQKLGQEAVLGQDRRAFTEAMGNLSIEDALNIADGEARATAAKQKWEGVGGVTTAVISGYDKYKATPTTEATGTSSGINPKTSQLRDPNG